MSMPSSPTTASAGAAGPQTVQPGQADMFSDAIQRELEQASTRHAQDHQLRAQRFEERRKALSDDVSCWAGHPLAPRIRAMADLLQQAGPKAQDMLNCIMAGINMRARHGQIDDATVEFLENKARIEIARIRQGDTPPAATWKERTGQSLAVEDVAIAALPLGIRQAAAVRINELGSQLAALGYSDHHEVNAASHEHARRLHRDIADIYNAMMSLAPSRYRAEKGYRNFKRENLERDENELSALLGIDTRELPGVCMDKPLTSSGLRQKAVRGKAKAKNGAGAALTAAIPSIQTDLLAA